MSTTPDLVDLFIEAHLAAEKAYVLRAIEHDVFPKDDAVLKALALLVLPAPNRAFLEGNDPETLAYAWRVMAARIRETQVPGT